MHGDIARQKANECAERNQNRHPNGRRYDRETMAYNVYMKELSGRRSHNTKRLNEFFSTPSLSNVEKYITKKRTTIVEGLLRTDDLVKFLKSQELEMCVSLSEDATNIVQRIEYSPKTNQIVGYSPPLNEEAGMPIPLTFEATSATVMENILLNPNHQNSTHAVMVLAQPLAMKTPPFCLLVYGSDNRHTKKHVVHRWEYIVKELGNAGIKVLCIASDSDSRYNGAMRDLVLSHKTDSSSAFSPWFNFDLSTAPYFAFQDYVHTGVKGRNRLLHEKVNLMFGECPITKQHLLTLVRDVSKQQHKLCKSDVDVKDRQNFLSVLKITADCVIKALEDNIENSAGTVMYLKLLRNIVTPYLDFTLSPKERVYRQFHAVFILRTWKEFLARDKTRKAKEKALMFITEYTYICIEINAHSMVSLILDLRANGLERLFLPHLLSSQPCESYFREIRSLSTKGTLVTNTTMLGMIHRCEKVELSHEIRIGLKNYEFTSDTNRARDIYCGTNTCTDYQKHTLPDFIELMAEIERAKNDAVSDAALLGVQLDPPHHYACHIEPTHSRQSKPILHSVSRADGTKLTKFQAINLKDCTELIDFTKFNEKSTYVAVDDVKLNGTGERRIYVRKSALVSLYVENGTKLSSDRNRRVMQGSRRIELQANAAQISIEDSSDNNNNQPLIETVSNRLESVPNEPCGLLTDDCDDLSESLNVLWRF